MILTRFPPRHWHLILEKDLESGKTPHFSAPDCSLCTLLITMMRALWLITTFLPILVCGKERGRRSPDNESYTRRRRLLESYELRGKGKYGTGFPVTYSPTSSSSATKFPSSIPGSQAPVEDGDRAPGDDGVPPKGITITDAPTIEPSFQTTNTITPNETTEFPTKEPAVMETDPPVINPPETPVFSPTSPPVPEPTVPPLIDPSLVEQLEEITPLLYNQSAFSDVNSYQYRALLRTSQQVGFGSFSFWKLIQYWSLYCIYFATNGAVNGIETGNNVFARQEGDLMPGWKNTDGWEEYNLAPCDGWFGIACDNNDRVTEIHFQRNQLSGTFPPEVSFLASEGDYSWDAGALKKLEIFSNKLLTNNPEQNSWIAALEGDLQVLNYGSTSFRGPIPKLPSSLVEFDCSYTLHSGPIPESSFDGLNDLKLLILDGNSYGSSVPSIFGGLPSLKYFYIREASLTGDLSYMRNMTSIVEHMVDSNPDLSGPIYPEIGQLRTLKSFSVADCGLVRYVFYYFSTRQKE